MTENKIIQGGVGHDLPPDLKRALAADSQALAAWGDITPLSRNEWICWTISVQREATRRDHVRRVISELKQGIRRPCCWIGCTHRKDKKMSASQKWVLSRRGKGR